MILKDWGNLKDTCWMQAILTDGIEMETTQICIEGYSVTVIPQILSFVGTMTTLGENFKIDCKCIPVNTEDRLPEKPVWKYKLEDVKPEVRDK